MDALPEVSRLARASGGDWLTLGERLRAAGYTRGFAAPILRLGRRYPPPLPAPLHLWHLRSQSGPAAVAMRMLGVGDPVGEDEARAVVGADLFTRLVDEGFLVSTPAGFASPFAVSCFGDAYAVYDRTSSCADAVRPEVVPLDGLWEAARPASSVESLIQLGCGSAAWASALAGRASRVVAVDKNPRALALARVASLLSGATNVELREGEGFAAKPGETFDVVVAAPPCLAKPPATEHRAHLYGGPRGDEAALAILAALPRRLSAGGRATIVTDFPLLPRERPFAARVRAALDDGKARALLLTIVRDLDEHCGLVCMVEHPKLGAPLAEAVMALRSHYAELGATGIARAVVLVEPARSGTKYVAAQAVTTPSADAPLTAARVDALFGVNDVLAGGKSALLAACLRIPEGAAFSSAGADGVSVRFSRDDLVPNTTVAANVYAVASALTKAATVEEGLRVFARATGVAPAAAAAKLLPLVERALREGILIVSRE